MLENNLKTSLNFFMLGFILEVNLHFSGLRTFKDERRNLADETKQNLDLKCRAEIFAGYRKTLQGLRSFENLILEFKI